MSELEAFLTPPECMFTRSPAASVSEANSDGKPEPEVNTIEPVITAIPANGKPLLAWVGAHEADTANEADVAFIAQLEVPNKLPVNPEVDVILPLITSEPDTSKLLDTSSVSILPLSK
jgi:hypothetical protein